MPAPQHDRVTECPSWHPTNIVKALKANSTLKQNCKCFVYVFVRCNNVLYIRGVEDEDEEGEMRE